MSGLKQFNWDEYAESVKAGAPLKVQTRSGSSVTQLSIFSLDEHATFIRAVLDGSIEGWYGDGRRCNAGRLSELDLFFAPKAHTGNTLPLVDLDCTVLFEEADASQLRESLKVLTRWKKGPKPKGYRITPAAAQRTERVM